MAFVFTWAGALGLVASVLALGLAVLVFWTRPARSQNRRLALMLSVEGLAFLGGTGAMFLTDSIASVWAWQALTPVFALASPFAYLLFLATLDTPLAGPLEHPIVEKALMGGFLLAPLLWFVAPEMFVESVVPGEYSPWGVVIGPGFLGMLAAVVAASLVGLVLAISAWRRSPAGSARRSQARSYAVAFGVRDLGLPVIFTLTLLSEGGLGGPALSFAAGVVLPASVLLAFVLLLAYGILKTQLFDIDLKVKWTLEKSTVAASFIAVFFVVSEGAQVVFAGFAGSEVLGVIAAGVLVFFLAPLQRLADRVGDVAMPKVEDTEAYREERKEEVYRASLEELLADGEVTAKERRMLGRLQGELGLEGGEASRIEAEMVEARGGQAV